LAALLMASVTFTGCDRGKVTAYDVPKETPPAQAMPGHGTGMDPHAGMAMSRPEVTWGALPEGWTESPQGTGMRLASFAIAGEDGQGAEMAIIPMGGFAGTDVQLVNMWRTQLGLTELVQAEAEGQGQAITVGGIEGRLYEMAGIAQDIATRILVVSASKDGVNYFFKLIGNDSVVAAQKDAFLGFLNSVEFAPAAPVVSAPALAASPAPSAEQRWTPLDGWEELPATQFLLAKYRVPGDQGESAEVTVSMLGGTAGGLLPNVNRWRGQLNLGPVDQAGLDALLSDIKAGSANAQLVELEGTDLKSGTPARMLAVVVALPTETWFFKMTGPPSVMDAKAGDFHTFVNRARF
jgi:hypothetical protein